MRDEQPLYIVVEGPIGVGKTSLAKRLADEFNSHLLLEAVEENPFLEKFYENPRQAALATQLFFLMQRSRQIDTLRQADIFSPVRVADFLIEKDFLFAQLTLDHDEFELYKQLYSHITVDAPRPDLVVYLQAPTDVLLDRISKRGRSYEQWIAPTYLEQVNDAYSRFFHHYDKAPLLIVNAGAIDLVNNQQDYEQLLKQIRSTQSGRHYFNPLPFDV